MSLCKLLFLWKVVEEEEEVPTKKKMKKVIQESKIINREKITVCVCIYIGDG